MPHQLLCRLFVVFSIRKEFEKAPLMIVERDGSIKNIELNINVCYKILTIIYDGSWELLGDLSLKSI